MFYAYTSHSTAIDAPSPVLSDAQRMRLQDDLVVTHCRNKWLVQSQRTGGWCVLDDAEYERMAAPLLAKSLAPYAALSSESEVERIVRHMTFCGLAAHASPPIHPPEVFSLTFLLSNQCNLNCRYCYLALDSRLQRKTLSMADAEDALNAAFHQPLQRILIDFGEIAVQFPFVQRLAKIATELARAHPDKDLQLAIQTNGTTLSEDVINFLEAYRFVVGISLDGPQLLHDATRAMAGNSGSHARCEAGLRALIRRGIPHIVLCTVSAANVGHADALASYFLELGVADFSFKPVIRRGSAQEDWAHTGVSVVDYNQFLDDLVRYSIDTRQWNALDDRLIRFLFRLLRDPRGWSDACPTAGCGCGQRLFVVNPYGAIYPCPRFATAEEPSSDTLGHNLQAVLDSNQHQRFCASIPRLSECLRCTWAPYCAGGCSLVQVDPLCEVYRHMYELILTQILPRIGVVGSHNSKIGRISVVEESVD